MIGVKTKSKKARTERAIRPVDEVIPCGKPVLFDKDMVEKYAEELRKAAPTIGIKLHKFSRDSFLESGLFDSAIERLRGQKAAKTHEKRLFIEAVLNDLKERKLITSWESTAGQKRADYEILRNDGRTTAIEAKGCPDGHNTTISDRPTAADEFIIWSLCQNVGTDMKKGAWSGIHTRIGPDMMSSAKKVDGLIIWDSLCATRLRPCPKIRGKKRLTKLIANSENGEKAFKVFMAPPPCIFTFPETKPNFEDNANPRPRVLKSSDRSFLAILFRAYGCKADEVTAVQYCLEYAGGRRARRTVLWRSDKIVAESDLCDLKQKSKNG